MSFSLHLFQESSFLDLTVLGAYQLHRSCIEFSLVVFSMLAYMCLTFIPCRGFSCYLFPQQQGRWGRPFFRPLLCFLSLSIRRRSSRFGSILRISSELIGPMFFLFFFSCNESSLRYRKRMHVEGGGSLASDCSHAVTLTNHTNDQTKRRFFSKIHCTAAGQVLYALAREPPQISKILLFVPQNPKIFSDLGRSRGAQSCLFFIFSLAAREGCCLEKQASQKI